MRVQGEGDLGIKVRCLLVRVLMACVAVPNLILILLHTYESRRPSATPLPQSKTPPLPSPPPCAPCRTN